MRITGRTIKKVYIGNKKFFEDQGWGDYPYGAATIVELDDGSVIFASQDEEGNGPGLMFGIDNKGRNFYIGPEPEQAPKGEDGGVS